MLEMKGQRSKDAGDVPIQGNMIWKGSLVAGHDGGPDHLSTAEPAEAK